MYDPALETFWREVQRMSFIERRLWPAIWKVGAVDGRMTLDPIYTPEQQRLFAIRDQYLKEVYDHLHIGTRGVTPGCEHRHKEEE